MKLKTKILVCLIALLGTFGGGAAVGYHYAKTAVLQTVFTPYEDGLASYLKFLDTARKSVHIAGYAFTDQRIVAKLVELRARGVKVYVLLDRSQTAGWSLASERKAIDALRAAGCEVVIGTSEKSHEIMHNKYTIVDGIAVQDGSWNYTKSANSQANVLNFHHDSYRAGKFLSNWQRMHAFMTTQPQALPEPKDNDAPKAKAPKKR